MARKGQLTTASPFIGGEFQRFLTLLGNDGEYIWELYARLSFCTACRSSDVRVLRWRDVLGDKLQVTEKKTKKVRVIPLNAKTHERILDIYSLLGKPDEDDYIFKSRKTGKPITIQRVNQVLKEFKERYHLDIGNFSTHTFRKTFGRFVYEKPGDKSENLVMLNIILKHSSLDITKRYIGVTDEEVNDVFASIDI